MRHGCRDRNSKDWPLLGGPCGCGVGASSDRLTSLCRQPRAGSTSLALPLPAASFSGSSTQAAVGRSRGAVMRLLGLFSASSRSLSAVAHQHGGRDRQQW